MFIGILFRGQKYKELQEWIDTIQMKGKPAYGYRPNFLGKVVFFIAGKILGKEPLAITIGYTILAKSLHASIIQRITKHEYTHVLQMYREGWIVHSIKYIYYYFKNLIKLKDSKQAYLNIPYEIEARQKELL